MAPWRRWALAVGLGLAFALLAACGGGGGANTPVAPAAVALPAVNPSSNPTQFQCPTGQSLTGYGPTSCCPTGDLYNPDKQLCIAPPPPPPLSCPAGQSLTGYGAQCCPTGDTGDGTTCFAPPPATCPSNTYGTPPNCIPIPSCSAVVGAYWGGPATGCVCPAGATGTYPACVQPCPPGDTGTYPNCVPPPSCTGVPGAYWGGPATGCVCGSGYAGAFPNCIAESSIVLTLSANVDPNVVNDTSAGNTPATSAVVSWSVSSNVLGDAFLCTVNGGSVQQSPTSVSGYSALEDGPQPIVVSCSDTWRVVASKTLTLTVVAPPAAPPDQFTEYANSDGTWTFGWYSYGTQGCEVRQFNSQGVETTLIPAGNTSGSSTTAVLFSTYAPYTMTLYCGGVPDNVPSFTVSP